MDALSLNLDSYKLETICNKPRKVKKISMLFSNFCRGLKSVARKNGFLGFFLPSRPMKMKFFEISFLTKFWSSIKELKNKIKKIDLSLFLRSGHPFE